MFSSYFFSYLQDDTQIIYQFDIYAILSVLLLSKAFHIFVS